ncbi:MAG: fatty acid desaturase [Sandaracinaceae bacterium]|nr:fatty acid desaturase [Sandaracinaceae bacterium]
MSSIAASLTTSPFAQFRRHPTFYVWYDSFYAVAALTGALALIQSGWQGLLPELHLWHLGLLPPALYVMIMAHVFVHNASHGNFPKAINRLMGELTGALVLTKFASWEIVHRRHHRYSDDPVRDPHPAERGYWRYAINTLINVELQLRQEYYDTHGDTAQTRRYERWRARLSFVSGVCMLFFYFLLLGPSGFFLVYLPAFVGAALFVIHFNWSGHNAHRPEYPIAPADLDYGWFWIGNRIFFGIYFHGTHHKLAMLFNPMKAPAHLRAKAQARVGAPADDEEDEAPAVA